MGGGLRGVHRREKMELKVVGVWRRSLYGSAATKGGEAQEERKGRWFPGLCGGDGGRERKGGGVRSHLDQRTSSRSSRSGPRSCQSASSSSCPKNRAQGPRPGGDEVVPEASQTQPQDEESAHLFSDSTQYTAPILCRVSRRCRHRGSGVGGEDQGSRRTRGCCLGLRAWGTSLFLFQ